MVNLTLNAELIRKIRQLNPDQLQMFIDEVDEIKLFCLREQRQQRERGDKS